MKFIKIYGLTFVLCGLFLVLGGWMLFDFDNSFFVATAACAFIIAVIASVFVSQDEKMVELENRIRELEEKSNSSL